MILGIVALVMSIVGLVQATRRNATNGAVATFALLASIGSIGAGFKATNAMEDEARESGVRTSQIADCVAKAQTADEIWACTD